MLDRMFALSAVAPMFEGPTLRKTTKMRLKKWS
jgi:hypothetical protein